MRWRCAQVMAVILMTTSSAMVGAQESSPSRTLGMVLVDLDQASLDYLAEATGVRGGVLIDQVLGKSPAAEAGLEGDSVLAQVAGKPVTSVSAADQALGAASGTVTIVVLSEGKNEDEIDIRTIVLNVGETVAPAQPPASKDTPHVDEINQKLAALEEALAAGLFTQAEHDKLKAELTAQLAAATRQPDTETQKKLEALEVAYNAGVFTEEQYRRKKAELLGQPPPVTQQVRPVTQTNFPEVSGDPMTAYFDMMDFVRTQAWGKQVTTSAAQRQNVGALVRQSMAKADAETVAALNKIPQVWAELQRLWAGGNEQDKSKRREYWRGQLLLPSQFFPPPINASTYRSDGDTMRFQHPGDWVVAKNTDEGSAYLYLAPPGTQTTWEKVADPAASPGGALFVVAPIDESVRTIGTYVEGARQLASRYVTSGSPDMKEVWSFDDKDVGGVIVLRGRCAGSQEERFYWFGIVRFGEGHFLAARLGGPVAQADVLVPSFYNMLATLELNPPGGTGAGYTGFALGAEMLRNATLGAGWYTQNWGE